MPFASKAKGINLMEYAIDATLGDGLSISEEIWEPPSKAWAVKSPQFSWVKLRKAYPYLGPEMRSTGEVACLGLTLWDTLLKSWLSAQPNKLPRKTVLIYTYVHRDVKQILQVAKILNKKLNVITIEDSELAPYIESISRSKIEELMKFGEIDLVITSGYTPDRDYKIRRLAIDLNIPTILHPDTALALAKALNWYWRGGQLTVMELKEYWSLNNEIT